MKPTPRRHPEGKVRHLLAAVDATVIGPADLPGSMLASARAIPTDTAEQLTT